MATQPNLITAEQYQHYFEGAPGYRDELINGRIVMTPDAKPLHQQVQDNMRDLLKPACKVANYVVHGNTNVKLTPVDMPSPDLFIVSWPAWRRAMHSGEYVDVAPLLVVEILSPGQNVSEKVEIYLRARVDQVWVVDPERRAVFVETRPAERIMYERAFYAHDAITLPSPLKGSIKVSDIFAGIPENCFTEEEPK